MDNFSGKISWFMPLAKSDDFGVSENDAFFDSREFLSSGRDALFRILKLENFRAPRTLYVPEYFCPSILRSLRESVVVQTYKDYPSEVSPHFEMLNPRAGDAVVAVDFFGLRDMKLWDVWFASHSGVVSIEDLSHVPFSARAESSPSDYRFASMRKYLPLPDGAWLRSKNFAPAKMFLSGGDLQSFASDALAAASVELSLGYDAAEPLFYSGEGKLDARKNFARISKYSLRLLHCFDIEKLCERRLENLRTFCGALRKSPRVRELNSKFENLENPREVFCPALKFSDARLRDTCHNALVATGAMPSIYWGGLGKRVSEDAHFESGTSLTIPLDFRHTRNDALMCAEVVSKCV